VNFEILGAVVAFTLGWLSGAFLVRGEGPTTDFERNGRRYRKWRAATFVVAAAAPLGLNCRHLLGHLGFMVAAYGWCALLGAGFGAWMTFPCPACGKPITGSGRGGAGTSKCLNCGLPIGGYE
jgi:hypothetical protein